jgi:triacylglycerol lipase
MTRDECLAALDPQLAAMADQPSARLADTDLALVRQGAEAMFIARLPPMVQAPQIEVVEGLQGQPPVEVRVHLPVAGAPTRAILHIHGGGMVMGSARAFDGGASAGAQVHQAVIVSVEYRLAPEAPFPGPLLDCVAAWLWLLDNCTRWGLGAGQCLVMGENAGGGLGAALSLYLRDNNLPRPAAQILVFPMLDHLTGQGEAEMTDTRIGWTSGNNQFGWRALLGDQALPTGQSLGHYSPAHAEDFSNLPPTWIGVGTLDLFLDENIAFIQAIAHAHGNAILHTYQGAPHGFQSYPSDVSRRFQADLKAAIAGDWAG